MKSIINRRRACANSGSNEIVFVDYVDNLNNSYIDTGVSIEGSSDINYNIEFSLLQSPVSLKNYTILGAEDVSERAGLFIYYYKNGLKIEAKNNYCNEFHTLDLLPKVLKVNTIECVNKVLYINGSNGIRIRTSTPITTNTIFLFKINTNPDSVLETLYYIAPIRFYKANLSTGIIENPTWLFDLYPCRIGNAGYVYDKVRNRVLGDGSLTPGPDSANQTPWINN